MKYNRRNYYRILQSQPDASPEIIKSNYRTLLQKLKIHPDLGGEDWNASLINQAYNTLRNPAKRTAYDRELLRQHKISTLSRGHFNRSSNKSNYHDRKSLLDKHGNKRNYYRVLHIQPDSPIAIIEASYRILINKPNSPNELLKEAHLILTNRERRAVYDRLLVDYSHSDIANMQYKGNKKNNIKIRPVNSGITQLLIKQELSNLNVTNLRKYPSRIRDSRLKSGYQPIIKKYCVFCKTPYSHSPCSFSVQLCKECNSPLLPPQNRLVKQPRRILERMVKNGLVNIYTSWPGKQYQADLSDLSPTGMLFSSSRNLDNGQIIKIDGDGFKAVGEVTHRHINENRYAAGVRFLTIHFNKQKGHFLSESA